MIDTNVQNPVTLDKLCFIDKRRRATILSCRCCGITIATFYQCAKPILGKQSYFYPSNCKCGNCDPLRDLKVEDIYRELPYLNREGALHL